jgi:hypothetical protein
MEAEKYHNNVSLFHVKELNLNGWRSWPVMDLYFSRISGSFIIQVVKSSKALDIYIGLSYINYAYLEISPFTPSLCLNRDCPHSGILENVGAVHVVKKSRAFNEI